VDEDKSGGKCLLEIIESIMTRGIELLGNVLPCKVSDLQSLDPTFF